MTEFLSWLLYGGTAIGAAVGVVLFVLGRIAQGMDRKLEAAAGLTPASSYNGMWECVVNGLRLVYLKVVIPLSRREGITEAEWDKMVDSLPDDQLDRMLQITHHLAAKARGERAIREEGGTDETVPPSDEGIPDETDSEAVVPQSLGIEVYQPRTALETLLEILGGPEHVVHKSLKTAAPEARAKLVKLVAQYRVIERRCDETGEDDEVELFERRWDRPTAYLIMFYPTAGWPYNRMVAGLCLLLIVAGSLRVAVLTLLGH